MTASQPFAPPAERDVTSTGITAVVAAWAMSGACAGTLIGGTLQLVGVVGGIVPLGLGTAAAFAIGGLMAWMVDRRLAQDRPAVVDGRGRLTRPPRPWLLAIPLALGIAALLGLVVIASVRHESLAPGVAFAIVALGFSFLSRPLATSSLLARAVEAAESGDAKGARARFERVHRSWWASRGGKAQAQLNLGLIALREGDLEAAERWYGLPSRGRAASFAAAGLALVYVLRGRHAEAEEALRGAGGGGPAVQGELDGVRLLLVLRRDGPEAARSLGEHLHDPSCGALFVGALAAARLGVGDREGARALLGERGLDALMAAVLPEVVDL